MPEDDADQSEEEVQVLAGKRPPNLDEILKRQNEAEMFLKRHMDETEDKFKGLSLKQKKELVQEEQKQQDSTDTKKVKNAFKK